jgi:hypothetical protein
MSVPRIISCEVLRNEIEAVLARDGRGLQADFVDGALHDYPDKLRAELQECIDAVPGDCDVYLCCARCSNGTVGLRGGEHRLVLPAADDCIALLLGSRARYLEEHGAQPGTYYYTRGWIDFIDDPYGEYLKIVPKYGEEKSAMIARTIMEHYTRIAVIETAGVAELDDKREYLETVCGFYDLPLERLTGSLRFLEKLVSGPHDDEFIVVEPGDVLDEARFWALPGV